MMVTLAEKLFSQFLYTAQTVSREHCVCIYVKVASEEKELHGFEIVYHENDLTFISFYFLNLCAIHHV